MKILHIVPSMDPKAGGVCQAVKSLISGLLDLGIENEIVCMDNPSKPFLHSRQLTMHPVGEGRTAWKYNPKLASWLDANARRFDRFIVHGLWNYYTYAAYKILVRKHRLSDRVMLMPHGMLDPYFVLAPERRLKGYRNLIFWKMIESHLANHVGSLLFTCEEERRLAACIYRPYAPRQTVIVGLGIEPPPACDPGMQGDFLKLFDKLSDKKYLLFLGRIDQKKGVDILLDAYAAMLRQDQNLPDLVIAGPGFETEYGRQLIASILRDKLLETRVHRCGMISGSAKWGAFYHCEAFILPSHQENFGIAVAEAMACGRPVLVSDKVNIWKEIISDEAGLAASDDLQGVIRLIKTFAAFSPGQRLRMGEAAYKSYCTRFHISAAARKLEGVLRASVVTESIHPELGADTMSLENV